MQFSVQLVSCSLLLLETSGAQSRQALLPVEIPQAGNPSPQRLVAPGRPFFAQPRLSAGEAQLQADSSLLEALRGQLAIDPSEPLRPYEWTEHMPIGTGKSRHIGYVFCSVKQKLGKGPVAVCFQDQNRDRRFESVARFNGALPSNGLDFLPLNPIAYQYRGNTGGRQPFSTYTQQSIGLAYTYDASANRLRFRATIDFAGADDAVEIDPETLPSKITVSGAVVRIEKWDGKRATLAVEKPFPQRPLTAEYPDPQAPKTARYARLTLLTDPLP